MSILDRFGLAGRTALVTGCRRGIGRAIARALAEAGANVVGVSATMESQGSRIEAEVTATGRSFQGYACDFADRPALYRFIQQVTDDFPRIDILVNNAGTIVRHAAAEHADDDWDRVVEVNLSAQFILSREIGRRMLADPRRSEHNAKIVFIASLLTFQGGITVPGYSAAKGGIGQLTKALANEWAGRGVNVNAIAPGYIATDNTTALRNDPQRSAAILDRIPAGCWGQPEDLAGAALFLSSPASDYVHGTLLTVDGGWLGR